MFDNRANSGRIKINLENNVGINECKDWNVASTCKYIIRSSQYVKKINNVQSAYDLSE